MSSKQPYIWDDSEEQFEEKLDMPLDGGIRRFVMALRADGVETFESCEGGEGHAFTEPTIRFYGGAGAGFRAFAIAVDHGLPVFKMGRVYIVEDNVLTGPWWEIVFSRKDDGVKEIPDA